MNARRVGFFLLGGGAVAAWLTMRARRQHFSFLGKSVLITGGSGGLGLLVAQEICKQGGRVALLARDQNELRRARKQLIRDGGEAITVTCDLIDRAQTEAAVDEIVARLGSIDVLINNAGRIEIGPLSHMKRNDFERSLDLHFWAPFDLIMQVVPHMRRRGGGRIVNISSIGGKLAVPHLAPYCAGKFALTGLSDSVRAELALDNIQVTTVTPGLMRTGSEVNAKFKGDHAAECAWFSTAASLPVVSIQAERAAAQIVEACRVGQAAVILPLPARIGIAGNALFPNLTANVMKFVNRLLPPPVNSGGDELRSSWQSRESPRKSAWLKSFVASASSESFSNKD